MDTQTLKLQGRDITEDDIRLIKSLITTHSDWHRSRLSQELCTLWHWTNASGQMKDMACRSLLGKLHERGHIHLPEPRHQGPAYRARRIPEVSCDTTAIHCALSDLQPLQVSLVRTGPDWDLFRSLLVQYHYLGFERPVGESLRYLIRDQHGRLVALVLFGSAAWKLATRDTFVGWSPEQRQNRLQWVTNNTRFLIPPWVHVPHLASHVLGLVLRRLSADWIIRYGHPIVLLETFVGTAYRGTCYKAANWTYLGMTQGRGRNDLTHTAKRNPKAVFVYPLSRHFREVLMA